jgi:hypothetical protein
MHIHTNTQNKRLHICITCTHTSSLELGDLDTVRRALDAYNDRMGNDDSRNETQDLKAHRDGLLVCLIARAKLIILEHVQPNAALLQLAPSACVGAVLDSWEVCEIETCVN